MRAKQILGLTLLLLGLSLAGFGLSVLLSPVQYAARIKVNPVPASAYDILADPTFEIIQSRLVLSNAVASLNLNEKWGKKYADGSPLKISECISIIKKHLWAAPVRGANLITITFYSADPNEAVDVANAIAKGYRDYCIQSQKEMAEKGLKVLTEQFQAEETKIHEVQTNLDLLRQRFGIQSAENISTGHLPEQQSYWDEKQKLEQMLDSHNLLATKIKAQKIDMEIPKTTVVQFTDRAVPPQSPVGLSYFVGGALLVCGLILVLVGTFFLKSSRRQIT